jgi:DNA-binding NtrC family response regulator
MMSGEKTVGYLREATMAKSDLKIMLVDDEERYLETTRKLIEKKGYQAVTASSGSEALKKLAMESVNVVILDVKMPMMDGHEAFREIKKRHPLVEVIMLTGHATVESAIEGLKTGAFDYLMKPADVDMLIEKAEEAYEKYKKHQEKINMAMLERSMQSPRDILKG